MAAENEWIGLVHENMPNFTKELSDATVRDYLFLSMLERRGRVLRGVKMSYDYYWPVQRSEAPIETFNEGSVTYVRNDLLERAHLNVRGYLTKDLMSERETVLNAGTVAIVNRYQRTMQVLERSMRNRFCRELYIDGYAAGNENALCGLNSCTAYAGTPVDGDKLGLPSDTYAGLATDPAQMGTWTSDIFTLDSARTNQPITTATWTSDWPLGTGSTDYDYWSPLLVNVSYAWDGTNNNWSNLQLNIERMLRWTIEAQRVRGGVAAKPTLLIADQSYLVALKNSLAAFRHIQMPSAEADDLGFPGSINFDGITVYAEYGVPSRQAFLLTLEEIELLACYPQLFESKGPTWDQKEYGYLWTCGYFGNLKINSPKFVAKFVPMSG